jgi:septum formation protein
MAINARPIYLASRSPRRRELLRQIGLRHQVLLLRESPGRPADVDESAHPGEAPAAYVERVAYAKCRAGAHAVAARRLPQQLVLAADTSIDLDGEILGKPELPAAAARMLERLSGREHQVVTALAAQLGERAECVTIVSRVSFRRLTAAEIEAYANSGEPLDKAGGYAIQGRGAIFIDHLAGSYSGVVGLPLCETVQLLQRFGVPA